jgi:2-Cys peroxiredoxin 5
MKIASSIVALLAAFGSVSAIDVGDTIPADLTLHHGFPPERISLDGRLSGKNVLLLGLPGAFTPTWSSRQVPGYLANQKTLKALGVDDIIVYCVNDGAVMAAWAEDQGVKCLEDSKEDPDNILHLFADPYGLVTEALEMELTASGPKFKGLVNRSKRFALYVVDGTVQIARIAEAEDDPAGDDRPDSTLAEAMIEAITEYNNDNNSNDEL